MSSAHQTGMLFQPPDAANPERLRELRSFGAAEARREAHRRQTRARKEKLYQEILEFSCGRGGFTADELAAAWDCPANHVAPRISELLKSGRLIETGERRQTRSGSWAAVLEAADRA